jgi:polyisoprenoid-binding protein YceI
VIEGISQTQSGAEDGAEEHEHVVIVDRVPAGVWIVDPAGSQVNFRTRSLFGLVPVNGIFERFAGELRVDAAGATTGSLNVRVDSIQTGIDSRDERLRSAEFFDARTHPDVVFVVESIGPRTQQEMRLSEEDRMTISGRLELKGTSIELSFPVTVIAHGDHIHIEGKVKIDHQAAGLGWTRPGIVGKTVRADVALTLNPST